MSKICNICAQELSDSATVCSFCGERLGVPSNKNMGSSSIHQGQKPNNPGLPVQPLLSQHSTPLVHREPSKQASKPIIAIIVAIAAFTLGVGWFLLKNMDNEQAYPASTTQGLDSEQVMAAKLSGTYYVEASDNTALELENSFFEFSNGNKFLFYSEAVIGTGTYSINGNILSLNRAQFTISSDYQTISATDGSGKYKKESRPRFNKTMLSGIYKARENPNMALNYDGSVNNEYDDRYYEFFEDLTFKMVFPNSKDSSSSGTYKIQGDFLEMFFSYGDGSVIYLIDIDGTTISGGSSGGVAFTDGSWDK